jgi:hypothetical protein
VSDESELSDLQRTALLDFVATADATIGAGDFDQQAEWTDAELMALSLRAASLLGFAGDRLEQLFRREFGVSGVTEGDLDTLLAVIMLADVETRIKAAAGGKN